MQQSWCSTTAGRAAAAGPVLCPAAEGEEKTISTRACCCHRSMSKNVTISVGASPAPSPGSSGSPLRRGSTGLGSIGRGASGRIKRVMSREHPEEEDNVHGVQAGFADVALTMKVVADQARGAGTATRINPADPQHLGRRLRHGEVIPWYIIDPTGLLIEEQRSNASTRLQLDPDATGESFLCLSARQTARLLVLWPTLFPGWDWITGTLLLFTAFVTPWEVSATRPPACVPRASAPPRRAHARHLPSVPVRASRWASPPRRSSMGAFK